MWKKFGEYDPKRDFLAWACGIARLEALNYRRTVTSEPLMFNSEVMHLLAGTLSEISLSPQDDRLKKLKACVQKLPQNHQSMLARVYTDGCPCDAIARELGCSLQTIYNRMSNVRRRLLECVKQRSPLTQRVTEQSSHEH